MAIRSKYSLVILFLACETKNNEGEKKKRKKLKANSTWCSQAVTHPSINQARRCLTSVRSAWNGRWQAVKGEIDCINAHHLHTP